MNARIPGTPEAEPPWADEGARLFRRTVRRFIEQEFLPQQERWRAQHRPDAQAWRAAGRAGVLLPDVPEEFGGGGGTFAHEAIVIEELARAGVHFGSNLQSIVAHYILAYGSQAQKRSWLPRLASGELVAAIAMSEPGAGSDLQSMRTLARRVEDHCGAHYVLNGQKTFISNGFHASLVCVAAKTNPQASGMRSLSMIIVETANLPGFSVGRSLEKIGMHEQDTCELFFQDVRVPAANLLGVEGRGMSQMMEQLPYERLSIATSAVASTERALELTTAYAKDRVLFGKPLIELQNTRFKLAECKTKARIGRVFLDDCIARYLEGRLDDASAAMAKYWLTETQCSVIDECVQLHGGYGYMAEYPIARMWADSRVQRIYAGTNEVMKELIAWSL